MPAIRVIMPNGTTKSFREATPKSVIRQAQQDMLAEMKASGQYEGVDFPGFQDGSKQKQVVTQHAPVSGEPVFDEIEDYLNGVRPASPDSPPQAHVPTPPVYITDEAQIAENRKELGDRMDDLSLTAEVGSRVAQIKKIPKLPGALGLIGNIVGMKPIQDLLAQHYIDEHNRQTARIYNTIGNNALKRNGGIR